MKKQLIHSVDATNLGLLGSRGLRAECHRLGNFVYMTGQTGSTLGGQFVGRDPAATHVRVNLSSGHLCGALVLLTRVRDHAVV